MSESEVYRKAPFNQPIIMEPMASGKLMAVFKDNPDLVIRKLTPKLGVFGLKDQKKEIKDVVGAWKNFGRFVKVPEFNTVLGEDDEGYAFYVVVDRVKEKNLEEMVLNPEEKPEFEAKLNGMFCSLIDYSEDISKNGGPYMWDQILKQYVYDSTRSNPSKEFYFVDLGRETYFYDPKDNGLKGNFFFYNTYLRLISIMMYGAEGRFPDVSIIKARSRFLDFLQGIKEPNPYSPAIESLKEKTLRKLE
ncbi:hypothetical protein C4559_02375 [Candidatus Microgenomates bacterium]|nr:MAG: hypothetical protein C4559_02375 [Candidatus Microgenomates bacterium]